MILEQLLVNLTNQIVTFSTIFKQFQKILVDF